MLNLPSDSLTGFLVCVRVYRPILVPNQGTQSTPLKPFPAVSFDCNSSAVSRPATSSLAVSLCSTAPLLQPPARLLSRNASRLNLCCSRPSRSAHGTVLQQDWAFYRRTHSHTTRLISCSLVLAIFKKYKRLQFPNDILISYTDCKILDKNKCWKFMTIHLLTINHILFIFLQEEN